MQKTIIDGQKKPFNIGLKELIQYKDLFLILAYRDYRVRYAQTFLGSSWAIVQPLLTLLIFVLIFGKAAKIDTGAIPYPVFAVCGMSGWTYFAFVLQQSGNSIIGAQNMVKKIYFPRLIIPLSKGLVGLIDYGISFVFIVVLLIYFDFSPSSNLIYLPIFVILTVVSALSVGIWLSALTIRFRDFQHIVPFIVQFGLYVTPIAYPASIIMDRVPKIVSILYFMNPMAGIVVGFRWSILGTEPPGPLSFLSFGMVAVLFFTGLLYFKSTETTMADVV